MALTPALLKEEATLTCAHLGKMPIGAEVKVFVVTPGTVEVVKLDGSVVPVEVAYMCTPCYEAVDRANFYSTYGEVRRCA